MKIALIVVAALVALAAVLAVVVPLRVRLTAKGRGQFGDTWVIAGGLELFLITVSFAAAHAAPSLVQVHVAGRRVWVRRRTGAETPEEPASHASLVDKAKRVWAEIDQRFDRKLLASFVLGLRRHLRLEHCRGQLAYATPDVAFTGMLSGALYFVAGLLSPVGSFTVTPEWEDVLRAQGDIDVAVKVWPLRAIADIAWFVARNMRKRALPAAPAVVQPAQI